jgi:putative nucleotidyltransferase with HDIG domain
VPALPGVAVDAMRVAGDPDATYDDLRKVIEFDPGLTSGILRLANSVYFKGSGEIVSIRDALVRLGTKNVMELLVSVTVGPIACHRIAGYDLPPGDMLRHTVFVALGAGQLAQRLGMVLPAHGFTAGMLHDIGKILLGTFLEIDVEVIRSLAFTQQKPFDMAEREVLGIDHAEAGALLLQSWNVPESIVEVVRWHHLPDECPAADTTALDLVHVAETISQVAGLGAGLDGLNYTPSAKVLARLKITTQIAEEVAGRALAELQAVEPMLNLQQSGR